MTVAVIVLSIVVITVAAVAAVDLVPFLSTFIGRIHMGLVDDPREWEGMVYDIAVKWLKKSPSVPLSDNNRLTVIERVKGTYTKASLQSWQEASLLLGLNGKDCTEEIENFIFDRIDPITGEWVNPLESVDSVMLAYAIMTSSVSAGINFDAAMHYTYALIKSHITSNGTVCYSKSLPDVRFVDTIGMVCPFLFAYAKTYNEPEASVLAYNQMGEYLKYGFNPDFCLPVHAFNIGGGEPLGIYGWGRGCGWFAVGFADSIRIMNKNDARYLALLSAAEAFADALVGYQTKDGAFCRQLVGEQVPESSATAMLGWFLAEMCILTGNEAYGQAARSARAALMKYTRKDGKVDLAQGDTKGLGFYSANLNILPTAQGFALRLAETLKRM